MQFSTNISTLKLLQIKVRNYILQFMLSRERVENLLRASREIAADARDALMHPITYAQELRNKHGTGKVAMWSVGLANIVFGVGSIAIAQQHPETVSVTFPTMLAGSFTYLGLLIAYSHRNRTP